MIWSAPARIHVSEMKLSSGPKMAEHGRTAAVESVHLDARSHDVLLALRRYAEGRTAKGTALDWRVYTASMDLYTRFGAHEAVRGLLDREWLRLARQTD